MAREMWVSGQNSSKNIILNHFEPYKRIFIEIEPFLILENGKGSVGIDKICNQSQFW